MCGICGAVVAPDSNRRIDPNVMRRARDTLVHRGPDDRGMYVSTNAVLGHRRLSIVDVARGHQPLASDDGTCHLVYNGEVYNHLDIRQRLEREGHAFATACDTETVLRSYEAWGRNSVGHLRGMFAYAIWDEREGALFLARDRMGIKPLYYAHTTDGSLFFASEIKALIAAGAVRPELDLEVFPDYLANHATSGERTLFRGVRRLPSGHTLTWRDGTISIERFWDFPIEEAGTAELDEPVEAFRELLVESVQLRLMSDVPLGVFLSGGIDSAAITGIMATLVREPIKSFSVAFEEREANELGYARAVARAFGTDHHEIVVTPDQFFESLPRLVWHEDEPIAHPSSVPLHFVARLAHESVKVVLTGEGSDELLGGYHRYWKTMGNVRLGRATPAPLRGLLRFGVERLPESSRSRQRARRTFLCLDPDLESIYLDNFAVFSRSGQRKLLTDATLERATPASAYAAQREMLAAVSDASLLNQMLYVDLHTYLQELLMKQDQMSMAASIESRVPFLDHRLAEFAVRLPDRWKVRRTATKRILREAMKGVLPREIVDRPKMGFPVPFGSWIRGPYRAWVEDLLLGPRAAERGLFRMDHVQTLLAEHLEGAVDHSERIWSLVNVELWQRAFLDGERDDALSHLAVAEAG